MNEIQWTNRAEKQLSKIDTRYANTIRHQVSKLVDYPQTDLDTKKLKGENNKYRLRVGVYRILFEMISGKPRIISIQAVLKRSERTYA